MFHTILLIAIIVLVVAESAPSKQQIRKIVNGAKRNKPKNPKRLIHSHNLRKKREKNYK